MYKFEMEDLKTNPQVLDDIKKLERKIRKETGKEVALIAYTNKERRH